MTGQTVVCANTGNYCTDNGTFDSVTGECTWVRKLCVTCEPFGVSRAMINVQSNGLPAKCFYAADRRMVEQNIDFQVAFNQR